MVNPPTFQMGGKSLQLFSLSPPSLTWWRRPCLFEIIASFISHYCIADCFHTLLESCSFMGRGRELGDIALWSWFLIFQINKVGHWEFRFKKCFLFSIFSFSFYQCLFCWVKVNLSDVQKCYFYFFEDFNATLSDVEIVLGYGTLKCRKPTRELLQSNCSRNQQYKFKKT